MHNAACMSRLAVKFKLPLSVAVVTVLAEASYTVLKPRVYYIVRLDPFSRAVPIILIQRQRNYLDVVKKEIYERENEIRVYIIKR